MTDENTLAESVERAPMTSQEQYLWARVYSNELDRLTKMLGGSEHLRLSASMEADAAVAALRERTR